MPLRSGSFREKTAGEQELDSGNVMRVRRTRTSPSLRPLARSELADGAGGAIPAALHANEAEAAVAVGGGGSVSLPVVTVGG